MKIDEILSRLQEQQPDVSNPDELTDRIMDSLPDLTPEQPKPARRIRLYIASAIAAAASVLLLLTLHYSEEPTSIEAVADSRQGEPTSVEAVADSKHGLSTSIEAVADLKHGLSTSIEALADSKHGLSTSVEAVADLRQEVPTSIEAVADSRQEEPTSVETVQIEYAQQTKRVQQAEPLNEVLTERDIPITRPENYKYTPEEIALMKKQAREAYLKWVELELEIAKYNQEQTANNYRDL